MSKAVQNAQQGRVPNCAERRHKMNSNEPLAFRMKPECLEDYVGQEHILAKDKILYRTI